MARESGSTAVTESAPARGPGRRAGRRILPRVLLLFGLLLTCTAIGLPGLFGDSTLPRLRPDPQFDVIELRGSASDGTIIDGHGGWFNHGRLTELVIRSDQEGSRWDRPADITIRNCRIRGSIRIMGLGRNGEAPKVRASSIRDGHTARAQAAAPTRILISGVEIEADHRIPLYLAPGVTRVTFENSRLSGWSSSVGLYLDAESAGNIIRNNVFAVRAGREVIAIDGSAGNCLEGNRFDFLSHGGIYLYRNSGEGGTVRHQTPHGNIIANNRFDTRSLDWRSHGIWLGSRNGKGVYRHDDDGYPFGSSLDNRDFADGNMLEKNVFTPPVARAIRDDGRNNRGQATKSGAR